MRMRLFVPMLAVLAIQSAYLANVLGQGYPSAQRLVRVIVPTPPGSGSDRVGRLVADRLRDDWKSPVVVENRAGAAGILGAEYVARSPADGYTILFCHTSLMLAPTLLPKVPYDFDRDFAPVSMVAFTPISFAIRADSGARTLAEFVAEARESRAPVSYGTNGEGTIYHIYGETLRFASGANLLMIPYKGEAAPFTDLLGGQIRATFASVGLAAPHVRGGKVRVLAIAKPSRSNILPEVPTFSEAGYPQLDASGWVGVMVPAGTPKAIIDKLSADLNRMLAAGDGLASALMDLGMDAFGMNSERFTEFLRDEGVKWKKMLQNAGIKGN